jgi:putative membrane protein
MQRRQTMSRDVELRKHVLFLIIGVAFFIWSYIGHYDTFGWIMLSLPIVMGLVATVVTYRRFTFTTFVYALGLMYVIILIIGAKYTYTYNPLFDLIKDSLGHTRNFYDRVGHFAQGFVPVLVFKEIILRPGHMKRGPFFYLVLLCMVLAFSAAWELLEFGAVLISGMDARYILSLQGDMLDTQWDMFMAVIGAVISLIMLNKYHDKKMAELE